MRIARRISNEPHYVQPDGRKGRSGYAAGPWRLIEGFVSDLHQKANDEAMRREGCGTKSNN